MTAVDLIMWVEWFFRFYVILLILRLVASWFPELQRQRWVAIIAVYTDPYLGFFQRWVPPIRMIDLSPLFAFLSLNIIQRAIEHLIILIFP